MSKFCGNCGSQMDDSATVCGYCGAPLTAAPNGGGRPQAGGKKFDVQQILKSVNFEKNKNLFIKCGAGIAGLIVVIVIIAVVVSNTGCKGLAKKYMRAFENSDGTAASELYCSYIKEQNDDLSDNLTDYFDNIKENVIEEELDSSDYKIKYEITDIKELSNKKVKDIKDSVGEEDEDEVKALEDFTTVKIRIEATEKGGSGKESFKINLTVAKDSGSWKIFSAAYDD